jgi:hypothetical protein
MVWHGIGKSIRIIEICDNREYPHKLVGVAAKK